MRELYANDASDTERIVLVYLMSLSHESLKDVNKDDTVSVVVAAAAIALLLLRLREPMPISVHAGIAV